MASANSGILVWQINHALQELGPTFSSIVELRDWNKQTRSVYEIFNTK